MDFINNFSIKYPVSIGLNPMLNWSSFLFYKIYKKVPLKAARNGRYRHRKFYKYFQELFKVNLHQKQPVRRN